ncbi:MAG: WD40 repeat domain-containing protein, partial [Comamonadaceae bacterium]
MPAARICSLAEVAHLLPPDCALAERLREDTNSLDEATAIVITGPWRCPELHLPDMLGQGSPLRHLLDPETQSSALRTLVLILVEGDLDIDGALTGHDDDGEPPCLVVLGSARMHNLILCEASLHVRGDLVVQDLLWGDGISTALQVHGHLQARVALLADAFQVQMASTMHVEFLMDEVSGVPHLAEFSSEIVDAVFPLEFHDGINACEKGLGLMLDRDSVIAAVRAGTNATRTSEEIHTLLPIDTSLCPGGALTAEHLLQLLRTPVIAHKEHTASGWFKQTDFYLCRRHVDAEGDQRADNVFITVWKTWDFYISVEHVPEAKGLLARWTAFRQRRTIPTHPELTVAYRSYTDGQPGEWGVLGGMDAPNVVADPAQAEARAACQNAWRGVLDYVRKAVGQHKAHYPLYQQVQAELTARHVEDFTSLPVFTERYNDWWDSDKNGHWQDEVWVGARQPCMHDGEPWGRALKFGWQNGSPAHGDYD